MKLITPVQLSPLTHPISLQQPVCLLGSCFSDNIGQLLLTHKFNVQTNPFGTIFNPVSIARLLQWCLQDLPLDQNLVIMQDGVFKHFHLHSSIYAHQEDILWQCLENLKESVKAFLSNCSHLIITLGTAWVHEHIATGAIVANCHKSPSKNFKKRILSAAEVFEALKQIHILLPNTQIICTVSPVRHIKDTLPLNTLSKSTLILGIYQFLHNNPHAYYFPSYELFIDEMRDYRFYDSDLIHPNGMGVQYVWEKFIVNCLDTASQQFIATWGNIAKGLFHRPLVAHTPQHRQFLEHLLSQLQSIEQVDVSQEIAQIQQKISLFKS